MKKTLLFFVFFPFIGAFAQEYQTLTTTGYNADVIANGVNPSSVSTNISVDNADFAFLSADFQASAENDLPVFALPTNGAITTALAVGPNYQLAPFSENNSLRLPEQFETGTLTFSNAVAATSLYLLVTSGSGQSEISGTIHFSDNTAQSIGFTAIPDWFFSFDLPIVISGFGRVNRNDDVIENPANDPRLYQLEIAILAANQTKTITSIDIEKTSSEEGVINVLGASIKVLPTCPNPENLQSVAAANSATISWTAASVAPAGGYDYYYSTSDTEPTAPLGNVSSSQTTVAFPGLSTGVTYYFWVRSHCSDTDQGNWVMSSFITGQLENTYNEGDISTSYVDFVDVTTSSACPGVMSVFVPEGYSIGSVSTSYSMQTSSNGWMAEQRSLLVCTTTNTTEENVSVGVGSSTGTYEYSRSGLSLANGATGTVNFELRAWRTYGEGECDVEFNRVVNNTWTVTVTYQSLAVSSFKKDAFTVYPNPATDVVNVSGPQIIDEAHLYNVLGQEVRVEKAVNNNKLALNTSGLPTGKYILKVTSSEGVQNISVLKK